ncbi:MAG: aminoglycoside nucleotidyltransferase [Candidatus Nanopelagicales bacterium]
MALETAGVRACLGGGWSVDALLGEQTRVHSDLDLWVPANDLHQLLQVMVQHGVDRVFPWPGDQPWNWVLHDGVSRKVDLHLYEPVSDTEWHYGSALGGQTFPAEALAGRGSIGDLVVRCESAEWALRFHSGYEPQDTDRRDMRLLCERLGMELPPGLR